MEDVRARAEALAAAVCRRLAQASPFEQDRAHIEALVPELVAVTEVLLGTNPELPELPTAPSLKEPLALLNLLARRLGDVGVTPGAALLLTDALVAELRSTGLSVGERLHGALLAVAAEGYLRAREERVRDDLLEAFSRSIPLSIVGPRCALMTIGGPLASEHVRAAVESFGRFLLRHDVRGALIQVEQLVDATPAVAAELFAAHDVGVTVGTKVIFAGAEPALIEAARASRVAVDSLHLAPSFEEGLRSALLAAGLVLRPRSRLRALVGAE